MQQYKVAADNQNDCDEPDYTSRTLASRNPLKGTKATHFGTVLFPLSAPRKVPRL